MASTWIQRLVLSVAAGSLAAGLLGSAGFGGEDKPAKDKPGAGNVQFTELLVQDGYTYAYCVSAPDIDGDGHLDLVSADTTADTLFWFAHDGKGNFKRHYVAKNESGWLERHATGDFDGDGHPDIAIVKNLVGELVWFHNPGKPRAEGLWKKHVICRDFKRAYDIVAADFNGDGKLDTAAASWVGGTWEWFENNGKPHEGGEWQRHVIDSGIPDTRNIRVGDFNRDGKPDILGTSPRNNLVLWYQNPGKPDTKWIKHVIDTTTVWAVHGHPVDMDGDGDLDVVMAAGMTKPAAEQETHQVFWYENVGAPGSADKWVKHKIGDLDNAYEAVAGDLNGDGHVDVVATAWNQQGKIVWFENPGDPRKGPWKAHVLKPRWINANQVIIVDLDKDGRLDIVATAERGSNELRWWRNDGPKKR